MKILILEDSQDRINFFIELFKGHEVNVTDDVDEAIALLSEGRFNLIMIDNDLGLDKKEGVELAKFLASAQNEHNENTTKIIHSFNISASQKMKRMLPSAICMPFNPSRFKQFIRTCA